MPEDLPTNVLEEPGKNLLIVFTDEVGSTTKDENEFGSAGSDPAKVAAYKGNLVSRRCKQFAKLAIELHSLKSPRIVKNIGDALVITLEARDNDPALLPCLTSLHRAWRSLGSQIRVAVHLAPITAIATGDDLKKFNEILREAEPDLTDEKLAELWPALAIIGFDVFGAPMNRAARLAGVPHGAQFVVSEEVVIALAQKVGGNANERLAAGRAVLSAHLDAVTDLVPLVGIKNVERVSFANPWYILDIRKSAEAPSLTKQFKSVQAIRIIELSGVSLSSDCVSEATEQLTRSVVDPSTCTSFFVDLLFRIENAWTGYSIKRDRKFEELKALSERDTDREKTRASHVVFSGCPDLTADETLRNNRLSLKDDDDDWRLTPSTMRIYKEAKYLCLEPDMDLLSTSDYYLVEFQVRSGTEAPDSGEVFKNIKQTYHDGSLKTLAHGLLEGETDVFVLFREVKGKDPESVVKFLVGAQQKAGAGQPQFLDIVALTALYRLTLLHRNQQSEIWKALCDFRPFEKPGS